jgi:hypothetical protein
MAHNVDAVLGVDESSPAFLVVGNCDVVVQGLTSGAVKLQYKLTKTAALPSPAWTDMPDSTFTVDTYKTIFISEHGVTCRLTGASNNAGVYVRLAKFLNK